MQCDSCPEAAVISLPQLCKEHFIAHFEEKVRSTIEGYGLIAPGMRIAVAVSGGKDSLTVLTLLNRWYGNVTAIAIDEGIAGYREHTLEDARRVCAEQEISLIIRSYKDFAGMTLDEMLAKRQMHPCTLCGALRRHLLLIASKGFDVLATGHNADDEAQAVLMNIIRGNTEVFPRGGPVTGSGGQGFVRRVKPLYFCSEKEVMTYAFLKGLVGSGRGETSQEEGALVLPRFTECPNIDESYRHLVRDELNRYAQSRPGVKERLLHRFLVAKKAYPAKEMVLAACSSCGEPSSGERCKACTYLATLAS